MPPTAIVLWFGQELFMLVGDDLRRLEVPGKGDVLSVLVSELDAITPPLKRVRLIYEPGDLEMHTVDCVCAGRDVVRGLLAEEHPALRDADCAWATARLQPSDNGYATLLWVEPRSRLTRLRSGLAERGITLAGVWPLVSLIELVPPTDGPDRPALAVVLTDNAGAVYANIPGGGRTFVWTTGDEFRGQLGGLVRNALGHFELGQLPPTLVVDAGSAAWNLGVGPLAGVPISALQLDRLLAAAAGLPVRGCGNFLPQETRISGNVVFWAGAAMCLLGAIVNAGSYALEVRRFNDDATARAGIAAELQAGNARLLQNRLVIERVDALEREMNVGGEGRVRLLSAVMREKPVEITVHLIAIRGQSFEIAGTAHEGVGQPRGPFQQFVDALGTRSSPWQIAPESRPAVLDSSRFVVRGTFR